MRVKTLRDHRLAIKANANAYEHEIKENMDRLCGTLLNHLKQSRFAGVGLKAATPVLSEIIELIFEAQDRRPMFHIEGTELPLCWNSPKYWKEDYIKYEWGHLLSKNQNGEEANNIENLALYSARW